MLTSVSSGIPSCTRSIKERISNVTVYISMASNPTSSSLIINGIMMEFWADSPVTTVPIPSAETATLVCVLGPVEAINWSVIPATLL